MSDTLRRMYQRSDTAANWATFNPVLAEAEFGYDRSSREVKIGDGLTPWADLPVLGGGGGGGTNLNWVSVQADGSGDDFTTLQAALDAVPTEGAIVYLRDPDYYSSETISPKSNTLIMGRAAPRYQDGITTEGTTRIIALDGFTGPSLVQPVDGARGVGLVNMMLAGDGVGAGLHGFSTLDYSGEHGLTFNEVQIEGFTGAGFYGTLHVASFMNVHLSHNEWGLLTEGTARVVDTKWANVFVYFNRSGGLRLNNDTAGLFDLVNVRVERSGCDHLDASTPLNPDAPGIWISRLANSNWTNVSTDANTGEGMLIEHTVAGRAGTVVDLQFTTCIFKRDGWGDGVTDPERAGVRLTGFGPGGGDAVIHCRFVNCGTVVGNPDDSGSVPYVTPHYGVEWENTQDCAWVGTARGAVANWSFGASNGYANFRPLIIDHFSGLHTIPDLATGEPNADFRVRGMIAFDRDQGTIVAVDSNLNVVPVGGGSGGGGTVNAAVQAADLAVSDQSFVASDLVVPIEFGNTYVMTVRGTYTLDDAANGFKVRLENPDGANFELLTINAVAYGSSVAGGIEYAVNHSTYDTIIATAGGAAAATEYPFSLEITWVANGSGDVVVTWGNSGGATNAVLKAGSSIEVRNVSVAP